MPCCAGDEGDGPSEPPYGRGLQTTACCGTGDGVVVSDAEKASVKGRQVGTRKASASEPLLTCRY